MPAPYIVVHTLFERSCSQTMPVVVPQRSLFACILLMLSLSLLQMRRLPSLSISGGSCSSQAIFATGTKIQSFFQRSIIPSSVVSSLAEAQPTSLLRKGKDVHGFI